MSSEEPKTKYITFWYVPGDNSEAIMRQYAKVDGVPEPVLYIVETEGEDENPVKKPESLGGHRYFSRLTPRLTVAADRVKERGPRENLKKKSAPFHPMGSGYTAQTLRKNFV
ncbi:MAG: hypothetical protein PHY92_05950 [Alphaproteobacteria bacterium]|nr:hypothetical protein [Alphaproteobacteria bacterium]